MELKQNQSALILETSKDGEITVNVASGDIDGLTGLICQAIATKLMKDEQFQEELMTMLDKDEGGDG
jgi:hypothetical protein